jgi:hypothetical protein
MYLFEHRTQQCIRTGERPLTELLGAISNVCRDESNSTLTVDINGILLHQLPQPREARSGFDHGNIVLEARP